MMKSVIMVGGGVQQVKAVGMIKNAGFKAIVTDINTDAPAFNEADITVNVDARDVQSLISWILLNKETYNISGIFTLINQAATVALVGNATGLPSLSADIAISSDNKLLMKRKFKECGLPSANFLEIFSLEDAKAAFIELGDKNKFLKAVDSCGGKGVCEVGNLEELPASYEAIKQNTKFPSLILEEGLDGSFIDAQGIFYNGKFYRGGICDSFFSTDTEEFKKYNPVETYNISPSQHTASVIDDVYQLLERSARALGMDWGPVGGDFILTDAGLKIIEVGPRLHGPNGTLQIIPESTGIQPFEFMIHCIAGERPDEKYLEPKFNNTALCKVFVSSKENIKEIRFKEEPKNLEGLFSWFIYWKKNQKSVRTKTNLSGLASVFVKGKSYKQAIDNLKAVEDVFEII